MARIWIAWPVLLSFVAAFPAWGQSGDTIKIHVTYDAFGVRIRPDPGNASSHGDFTMTLSGKNEIGITGTARNESISRSVSGTTTFGNIQTSGDVTGAWHIDGPHKLVQIVDTPQNRAIATIVVTGKTCSYKIVLQLKPGSKEYKLFSASLNAWAYYSQVRYSNLTCTIQ